MAGRPTKYKKRYCQMLIEHMTQGYSFETFGCVIGVSHDTPFAWAKKYKDFADAKGRAFAASRLFWERLGLAQCTTGKLRDKDGTLITQKFNAAVWIFTMKNRFGWRDSVEVENSPNSSPQQVIHRWVVRNKQGEETEQATPEGRPNDGAFGFDQD